MKSRASVTTTVTPAMIDERPGRPIPRRLAVTTPAETDEHHPRQQDVHRRHGRQVGVPEGELDQELADDGQGDDDRRR